MATTVDEQLTKYLTDAHGIEEQALVQMRAAPEIAEDAALAQAFREHETETVRHERLVRERLEAHGAKPSRVEDVVMKAGGAAFVLFARSQPDTPGKLAAHAFSYEHLEYAAYELLRRVAERAGDDETVRTAQLIREDEAAMGRRLARSFDNAVAASLYGLEGEELERRFVNYLADAHALEQQAQELLARGRRIAGDDVLAVIYAEHLDETREHQRLVEERLAVHGAGPSAIKDAALRLGALNWGLFFAAQPDTPAKLAAFSYAFEHLEIAGYSELWRVARRVGDEETVATADRILAQEQAAALRIADAFDHVVEVALETRGVVLR